MRFSRYVWYASVTFKVSGPAFFLTVTSANGDGEIRTLDPLLARQVLSQLSYAPISDGSLVWFSGNFVFPDLHSRSFLRQWA